MKVNVVNKGIAITPRGKEMKIAYGRTKDNGVYLHRGSKFSETDLYTPEDEGWNTGKPFILRAKDGQLYKEIARDPSDDFLDIAYGLKSLQTGVVKVRWT